VRRLRFVFDLVCVLFHLALGTVIIFFSFPFFSVARRERLITWWASVMVALLGLSVRLEGDQRLKDTGHMLVLNHISWVDIYVIDVYRATRFVAKADIRSWPLIGWLCERTGTIFIERSRRHAVHGAIGAVANALSAGACVGLFPEGTTSDGLSLLPFHANLIQGAIDARVPIVPATLCYRNAQGQIATEAAYVGDMSLWDSLKALLLARPLSVTLTLLAPLESNGESRQLLAAAAEHAIAASLGLEIAEHHPKKAGRSASTASE
jgi:1-acyl-sn-glycerol-3-phosphate acyltransferase